MKKYFNRITVSAGILAAVTAFVFTFKPNEVVAPHEMAMVAEAIGERFAIVAKTNDVVMSLNYKLENDGTNAIPWGGYEYVDISHPNWNNRFHFARRVDTTFSVLANKVIGDHYKNASNSISSINDFYKSSFSANRGYIDIYTNEYITPPNATLDTGAAILVDFGPDGGVYKGRLAGASRGFQIEIFGWMLISPFGAKFTGFPSDTLLTTLPYDNITNSQWYFPISNVAPWEIEPISHSFVKYKSQVKPSGYLGHIFKSYLRQANVICNDPITISVSTQLSKYATSYMPKKRVAVTNDFTTFPPRMQVFTVDEYMRELNNSLSIQVTDYENPFGILSSTSPFYYIKDLLIRAVGITVAPYWIDSTQMDDLTILNTPTNDFPRILNDTNFVDNFMLFKTNDIPYNPINRTQLDEFSNIVARLVVKELDTTSVVSTNSWYYKIETGIHINKHDAYLELKDKMNNEEWVLQSSGGSFGMYYLVSGDLHTWYSDPYTISGYSYDISFLYSVGNLICDGESYANTNDITISSYVKPVAYGSSWPELRLSENETFLKTNEWVITGTEILPYPHYIYTNVPSAIYFGFPTINDLKGEDNVTDSWGWGLSGTSLMSWEQNAY